MEIGNSAISFVLRHSSYLYLLILKQTPVEFGFTYLLCAASTTWCEFLRIYALHITSIIRPESLHYPFTYHVI